MFHVRTALELLGTAPETDWTELPLFHEMEERKGERRQAQGHTQRSSSATAAGEANPDEAKEQRISNSRRKQNGRWLWAAGSG